MTDANGFQAPPTDVELEERITASLLKLTGPALKKLRFEVSHGVVTLIGEVGTRYERQVVHQFVERVPGVVTVVDKIALDGTEKAQPTKRRAAAGGVKVVEPTDSNKPVVRGAEKTPAVEAKTTVKKKLLIVVAGLGLTVASAVPIWFVYDKIANARQEVFQTSGRVMYGEEPAVGAKVTFHPMNGKANSPRPTGQCDRIGNFKLTTYEPNDGAPAGQYVVTIVWDKIIKGKNGKPDRPAVTAKLGSPGKSSMQAKVKKGTNYLPALNIPR